jgi:hypothetical protein
MRNHIMRGVLMTTVVITNAVEAPEDRPHFGLNFLTKE